MCIYKVLPQEKVVLLVSATKILHPGNKTFLSIRENVIDVKPYHPNYHYRSLKWLKGDGLLYNESKTQYIILFTSFFSQGTLSKALKPSIIKFKIQTRNYYKFILN